MEQFLVLMKYLSNGCHVVARADLLAGASLGFEQKLQLNFAIDFLIFFKLLNCGCFFGGEYPWLGFDRYFQTQLTAVDISWF